MDCEHSVLSKIYQSEGIGYMYLDSYIYQCAKCEKFFAIDYENSELPEDPQLPHV